MLFVFFTVFFHFKAISNSYQHIINTTMNFISTFLPICRYNNRLNSITILSCFTDSLYLSLFLNIFSSIGASLGLYGFDRSGCFILSELMRVWVRLLIVCWWGYWDYAMCFIFVHCFMYLISNVFIQFFCYNIVLICILQFYVILNSFHLH